MQAGCAVYIEAGTGSTQLYASSQCSLGICTAIRITIVQVYMLKQVASRFMR